MQISTVWGCAVSIRLLGKKAPRVDRRTLQLADFVELAKLPIIPDTLHIGAKIQGNEWGAMLNDQYGDCVIAAAGHAVQSWTATAPGSLIETIPDLEILKAYCDVGGYVPGKPSTDNGCVMLDALNYWRKTGIGGHKILAFVQINPKHTAMVRAAAWLFGGLYAGLALPSSAQRQYVWDWVPGSTPGSWGGHAVYMHRVFRGGAGCVTWGYPQEMTDQFIENCCDELYAVASDDWFGFDKTIAGFNRDELLRQLEVVTK